jgi:tetratricopeptide (TPR) repeat protein
MRRQLKNKKFLARKTLLGGMFGSLISCALLFVFASGCQTFNKSGRGQPGVHQTVRKLLGFPDDPYRTPIPDAPEAYHLAYAKLEAREYEAAIFGFSNFLRDQPTTNWTLAAQFNWGRALEGLERYREAAAKYQETAEKGRRVPKLQGLALLRMAVVLEALGEDARSLAALKDAEKRADKMSSEVAQTELPARLASAYARERNFEEAERYFDQADRQLGRLRSQIPENELPEWLPRILYAMGHRAAAVVQWDRFDASLIPLERSQLYLLQSAELGVEPWASQSANELIGAYAALRISIDAVPTPAASEIVIAAREQQHMRWDRLVKLSDSVAKLKTLFVTEIENNAAEGAPLKKITEFAAEFEEGIQSTLMEERRVGEAGTPDSIRRKSGVRGTAIQPTAAFPGEGGGE